MSYLLNQSIHHSIINIDIKGNHNLCSNLKILNTRKSTSHCVKNVRIRSYSGPYFPAFGMNTERYCISPYSVRMRENTGQNNSEYRHILLNESHSFSYYEYSAVDLQSRFCNHLLGKLSVVLTTTKVVAGVVTIDCLWVLTGQFSSYMCTAPAGKVW